MVRMECIPLMIQVGWMKMHTAILPKIEVMAIAVPRVMVKII